MSDPVNIPFNNNPMSGGRQTAQEELNRAVGVPGGPAPAAPRFEPLKQAAPIDYTARAFQAAEAPALPGGIDYAKKALDAAGIYRSARAANEAKFPYMTPVNDNEYGIINRSLLDVEANGGDVTAASYKWATAVEMSRFFGRPINNTMENLDTFYRAWTGKDFTPTQGAFEAITDSFRIGILNDQLGKAAGAWKAAGGGEQGIEEVKKLKEQIDALADNVPRNWFVTALKYGAQSAPFTLKTMASGLAAGAAVAGIASGVGAPAGVVGLLKAGASLAGSFAASAPTMAALDYLEMRDMGISHEIAEPISNVTGALNGVLEASLGNVAGMAGKVSGGVIDSIAGNVAKKFLISGASGAFAKGLMRYVGETAEEGVEEFLQQVTTDIGKNIAAELENNDIPQMTASEIAKDAAQAFVGGVAGAIFLGLPGAVIGYKGDAKASKALRDFATTTSRNTFIESASKWESVKDVPEATRAETLGTIWDKAQKKVEPPENVQASEPSEEAKPFERTDAGTLYTEDTPIASSEEGVQENIFKIGDDKTHERLGYLIYTFDEDTGITIKESKFEKGYKGLREEAIQELAAKYQGIEINVADTADAATKRAVAKIADMNPRGADKGAQIYGNSDSIEDTNAKQKLRTAIVQNMPNVTPSQREAAIIIHEMRANAIGKSFSQYVNDEFTNEIITSDQGKVSAAQGNRAGIGFEQDGKLLSIGNFVRDAKAIIMITEKSDFVSFVHESGHLFRKQLIGTELGTQLEEAYGITGGVWTRELEERFADDLTKYLTYGELKDEKLRGVFQRIAEWIKRLYDSVLSKNPEVDARVKSVMEQLFKSEKSPIGEKAVAEVQAKATETQEEQQKSEEAKTQAVEGEELSPQEAEEMSLELFQPDPAARSVEKIAFKFPKELVGYSDIHSQSQINGILTSFGRGVADQSGQNIRIGGIGESHIGLARGMQDAKRFYYGYDKASKTVFVVAKNGMDDSFIKNPKVLQMILSNVFDKFRLSTVPGKRMTFESDTTLFQGEVTETEQFKKWFGDSKVIDKKNKPLIVYHGGVEGVEVFQNPNVRAKDFLTQEAQAKLIDAVFFTESKTVAQTYKKKIEDRATRNSDPTGEIYSTYLRIENPLRIDMEGKKYNPGNVEGQLERAVREGHDGMIISNIVDDFMQVGKPTTIYVTFSPNQIKSATGNNGEFSTENDSILYQEDAIKTDSFKKFYEGTTEELLNPDGSPKALYSGHGNVALYGDKFNPKKATSGGFYATDSADLASKYATGKIGIREYYENGDEYRFAAKNGKLIKKLYQVELTENQKSKLAEMVEARDENGDSTYPIAEMPNYIEQNKQYDKQVRRWSYRGGINNLQNIFEFYDNMGDTIHQNIERESFLDDASNLSNFEILLNELGIDWDSYTRPSPGVMKLYMAIKNPIKTSEPFPKDLLKDLQEIAKRERKENDEYWTKNLSMKVWVDQIENDDGTHYWATQIPTKAMPSIEAHGYDGIIDFSGKASGEHNLVAVAFYSEQIKSVYNKNPTDDPRFLFQPDPDTISAEARTFDSWEAWKADVEASADFLGDQSSKPALTGAEADAWYKSTWEEATKKPANSTGKATSARGDFIADMTAPDGVEGFLTSIWDATLRFQDKTLAMDEEEQAELETSYEWMKELDHRLRKFPLVYNAAQKFGNKGELDPNTRAKILGFIRNNETAFKELYADLTGDEQVKAQVEETLKDIPEPQRATWKSMGIAEKTAVLNAIKTQEVKKKIEKGTYSDAELKDYSRIVEKELKALKEEVKAADEKIKELGNEIYDEKAESWKQYLKSKDVNTANTDALKSAREEAALQTREKEKEIRALYKLRDNRDALRRAIMKKPSRSTIDYKYYKPIEVIQEYLRGKQWEWEIKVDEMGQPLFTPTGKQQKKRKMETTISPDGTIGTTPSHSTTPVEGIKSAGSNLFKESPNIGAYIADNIVDRINTKPVSAWSMEELQELNGIIENLKAVGRAKRDAKIEARRAKDAGYMADVNETVRASKNFENPYGYGSQEAKKLTEKLEKKNLLNTAFINMRRFASIFLDSGADGVNTDLLVMQERKNYSKKMEAMNRRLAKVTDFMKAQNYDEKELRRTVSIPGIGPNDTAYTVKISDLMAMELAILDKDSRAGFIFGNLFSEQERRKYDIKELANLGTQKIKTVRQAIKDNLSATEKEITAMIGRDFDENFDRLNESVIELTNKEMVKVTHYFPIHRAGNYFDKFGSDTVNVMNKTLGLPSVPEKGFSIERIQISPRHQVPITLDLFATWQKAVDHQEHLIAYGGYIQTLNSVYKSRQSGSVREAIEQTLGKPGSAYIDEYISEIANPGMDKLKNDSATKILKILRGNMAVGYLAFRWTSVVKQVITSPLPFMAYAPRGTAAAAFDLMKSGHPMKWLAQVEGMSQWLKNRTIDQVFQTIKEMGDTGYEAVVKKIGTTGMKGLEYADRFSVAIGWKGVYDQSIAKGMTEEEAVAHADDVAMKTQPSARGADQAPVFRNANEWSRLLLQFGSALNVVFQNIYFDVPAAIRNKEYGNAIGIMASYAIGGILLGALAKATGKDAEDDPDEKWKLWAYYSMTQFSDSVPLIGQELSGVMKRVITGDNQLPFGKEILPTFGAVTKGFENITGGKILSAAGDFGEAIGLTLGLPVLASKEFLGYGKDILGGENGD